MDQGPLSHRVVIFQMAVTISEPNTDGVTQLACVTQHRPEHGNSKHPFFAKKLGIRLRAARDRLGWTRYRVSALTGIEYRTLAAVELGEVTPSVWTLWRVCSLIGVSIDSLLVGLDREEKQRHRKTAGLEFVESAADQLSESERLELIERLKVPKRRAARACKVPRCSAEEETSIRAAIDRENARKESERSGKSSASK